MFIHTQVEAPHWERLLDVIQRSRSIARHVDFFMWLQKGVAQFLPHDVLVAVWGDFEAGQLHYDMAAVDPEMHARRVAICGDLGPMMQGLFRRWHELGEHCFTINKFEFAAGATRDCPTSISGLEQMRSMLVHGVRDKRGKNDCLYAFLDQRPTFEAQRSVVDLLIPHIDGALRRVECLAPVPCDETDTFQRLPEDISEREREIMTWVRFGKTNHEIGILLNISPNTVKNHLKRIFQKLDVSSRAQAVAKFEARGQ